MLRITGGELRGRQISKPRGIRSTSEKVREAIFDILRERVADARVLELFAGSGALSFEALSRGAKEATLIEGNRLIAAVIHENIAILDLGKKASVVGSSSEQFLAQTSRPPSYNLIIMDPPYRFDLVKLQGLSAWLAIDGILVVEYAARNVKPEWVDLDEISTRRYGDTRVGFYCSREG